MVFIVLGAVVFPQQLKITFQIDFFELTLDGPLIGQKMTRFKMNCIINF